MKRLASILFASLICIIASAQVGLKDAYSDYFSMGVAVNVTNVTTPRQESLIRRNFNSITAEDDMKPIVVHPSENVWDWSKADTIANFCRRNGIKLRGHVLAWHSRFCDWMFVDDVGNPVTKGRFYERLRNHIHTVMNRYKDVVYAWDVVNEAIAEDEGQPDLDTCPYRKSKMYQLCGDEYIAKAFEFAHEVDSNAILMFNDYNTVNPGKRERMYKVVKKMLDAGVPITGIGMQGHYNLQVPSEKELETTISLFASLVDHIHITELDLSCLKTEGSVVTEAEKKNQERVYSMYFKLFRKYSNVIDNVTFWNLYDRESWIGSYNYPLLFDNNLNEKDAYYSVRDFQAPNVSDPFLVARLEFRNAKTYVNDYAGYLEAEGFRSLAASLRNYLSTFPAPKENADAYCMAAIEVRKKTEWAQNVANGYLDILNEKNNLEAFARKTCYPGLGAMTASLASVFADRSSIENETSLTAIRQSLKLIRRDYLFSQEISKGGCIDVTKMIRHPWFCEEEAEPIAINHGCPTYYVDWPKVYTTGDGWAHSESSSIAAESTFGAGFFQGRTAWFSRHRSDVAGCELVVSQSITELPEGFYSVSGDLISDEQPTDTHVFIKSGNGLSAKSPVLSGVRWNSVGTDMGTWETLSTDKIFVGKGDTLTIGVRSVTNGKAGNGSFGVTNFQLLYYDSNMQSEIGKLKEQIDGLIGLLMLKGDMRKAYDGLERILTNGQDDSQRLKNLLELIENIKLWLEKEGEFTALQELRELIPTITDERLSAIAKDMESAMAEKLEAEETTYVDLPLLTGECAEFFLYLDVVPYAINWKERSIKSMLDEQLASLSYATMTKQQLADNTNVLRTAMKKSMETVDASVSSPIDVSFLILNHSFRSGDETYWKGTQPVFSSGCAEFSNYNSFDMYQVLNDMPKGLYRLEAEGFYRDGQAKDAYGRYPKRTVNNANIYINNYYQYLSPWLSASNTQRYGDDDYSANGVFFYPMTAKSANHYFSSGHYSNSLECQMGSGNMAVGISKTVGIQDDWTVCDEIKLYYLGKGTGQSDDAYYVSVGDEDNVSYPYWTKFSDYYTIKDGFTGHFRFMNYSDMAKNWDNWIMAVTNRPDHNTGLYADYEEFFIIRADAYGWGNCFATGTVTHDFDFNTFREDMNGAFVDLYLSYKNGRLDMTSTITTNANEPDSSIKKEYHYSLQDVSGVYGEQVYVYFSVEKANLQGFIPMVTGVKDEAITARKPIETSVSYSLAGTPVNDGYRGIVIKDGKKILKR